MKKSELAEWMRAQSDSLTSIEKHLAVLLGESTETRAATGRIANAVQTESLASAQRDAAVRELSGHVGRMTDQVEQFRERIFGEVLNKHERRLNDHERRIEVLEPAGE